MRHRLSCGGTAASVCYAAGKESGSADSTTITEAGDDRGNAGGFTGFWCTDRYAVCGYAEAATTIKDIVVSVDEVGVSKTPGLRVNAPPSARSRPIRIGCSAGLGTRGAHLNFAEGVS